MAVPLALLALAPATALAHKGDPNFESVVDAVTPRVSGVSVTVVNRDDRFLLRNQSRETVVVRGYEDEPYARISPDGLVEVNLNSSAFYLNEDRYGKASTPSGLDRGAAPKWKRVDRTGRFEWHDHRMHYMVQGRRPPQVTDPDVRTKVFDYRVPIEVGGREGAIAGTLFWTPLPGASLPLGAILAFAGVAIVVSIAVLLVRRRRRETPEAGAW